MKPDNPRPRGRPIKTTRPRRQISLYLLPEELTAIDRARGDQDRNAWIRETITERLTRRVPTPGTGAGREERTE